MLERYQVVSDSLRGKTAVAPCPQLLSGARLEMFPIGLWHISHFHCLNQKKLLISIFLLMHFLMTVVTTLTLFVICKRLWIWVRFTPVGSIVDWNLNLTYFVLLEEKNTLLLWASWKRLLRFEANFYLLKYTKHTWSATSWNQEKMPVDDLIFAGLYKCFLGDTAVSQWFKSSGF